MSVWQSRRAARRYNSLPGWGGQAERSLRLPALALRTCGLWLRFSYTLNPDHPFWSLQRCQPNLQLRSCWRSACRACWRWHMTLRGCGVQARRQIRMREVLHPKHVAVRDGGNPWGASAICPKSTPSQSRVH